MNTDAAESAVLKMLCLGDASVFDELADCNLSL